VGDDCEALALNLRYLARNATGLLVRIGESLEFLGEMAQPSACHRRCGGRRSEPWPTFGLILPCAWRSDVKILGIASIEGAVVATDLMR
jgi:hypothetical protein